MWRYHQRTGWIVRSGRLAGIGYSGKEWGKNNPDFQTVPNVGPIPQGIWQVSEPFNSDRHGPFCLRLEPSQGTATFGRSGFLVHGDSIKNPGTASEGCIVAARMVREEIWDSEDHLIQVVP